LGGFISRLQSSISHPFLPPHPGFGGIASPTTDISRHILGAVTNDFPGFFKLSTAEAEQPKKNN
jgi:hypothetical protein